MSKGEESRGSPEVEAVASSDDVAVPQVASPEENHRSEEEAASTTTGRQETVKKDNGIPRIVLTFRTIDENTDHGKKTKISSCSSNLTLVPDELANCDQIGGVSVKIENSDENSDLVEESQVEESKKEESVKIAELKVGEDEAKDAEEKQSSDAQASVENKPEETVENNVEVNNVEAKLVEDTEQQETATTAPITRKRRIGRPRLRALRFLPFFYLSLN